MKTFYDYYNNKVKLSFEDHPFDPSPKHVWVICRYQKYWLLTKHRYRGLEFPGGKVEKNETPKEAAIREVYEETGGKVDCLEYIGQYYVAGKKEQLAKNIYFAAIRSIEKQSTYYETLGPKLLEHLPKNIRTNNEYSFIMKDNVLSDSINYMEEIGVPTYS
ncbi:phosphohydrolase [Gracilibacillus halophilus YIM-C55.5]|uniref:Phosphohydrolase n=1 Tax=Gracilibacillus halophilus YIM-C55.5 TaxID=1308866 RepID=N4WLV0_9BACI|nr:nucleoside triphosphatase YtkD [Gracilibacillus halophilus]ENH97127.1 phosphohydrolase [Gracilibacillus halophilus YIM-C55.5]